MGTHGFVIGFNFCVFVAGWRYALGVSGLLLLIITHGFIAHSSGTKGISPQSSLPCGTAVESKAHTHMVHMVWHEAASTLPCLPDSGSCAGGTPPQKRGACVGQ